MQGLLLKFQVQMFLTANSLLSAYFQLDFFFFFSPFKSTASNLGGTFSPPPLLIPDLEAQLAAAPTLLPRTRFSLQKHIRSSLNLH